MSLLMTPSYIVAILIAYDARLQEVKSEKVCPFFTSEKGWAYINLENFDFILNNEEKPFTFLGIEF